MRKLLFVFETQKRKKSVCMNNVWAISQMAAAYFQSEELHQL